ncbi:MAG: hypothetical protein JRJ66_00215 [Deltaproteobacteria bacterium]|nr:hypothetical protein [Deltaproteobacteria bacterium]MBW1934051.1 hypothetical protein [Deltaproteobacteria bacterium]MBW2043345.1 hypothetical protein [Deltaproteobacteria bacterium]RLB36160.1 MAG: hypothetical protein DRH11_00430 [Deltaproteobacteria bacterium]
MSGTTDMNIVLGQGAAIKEVHNAKKQNLELNQQLIAQKIEDKKRDDKSRVQKSEKGDKVEISSDEQHRKDKGEPKGEKFPKKRKKGKGVYLSEGSFIDIKV